MPAIPPNILASENLPMVMLTVSKDVTMFGRAYTDYEDLDFDGVVDYTFNPAFSYYGYFDASKCYSYSTANSRYEPAGNAAVESGKLYCNAGATTGQWSGNFLNWATMSRIDVLRKVLYGGYRATDSATDSVLEMSFVPRNSQAIAKYYNGADLARLTPYNSTTAVAQGITLCRRPVENTGITHTNAFTPQIRVAIGNYILWNMT
jgi:type IV pilus assembly protein PilY1